MAEIRTLLTLFFLSNPLPFNGQNYEKQKALELVTRHSSGYKTNSEKSLYLSKFDDVT